MDDERPPAAAPAEVHLQILEHGRRVEAPPRRQRHRQQPRRLVQDDHRVVLVDDGRDRDRRRVSCGRLALPGRSAQSRTMSPADRRVAASASVTSRSLRNTLPRSSAAAARARDPARSASGEILVEPDAGVFRAEGPLRHRGYLDCSVSRQLQPVARSATRSRRRQCLFCFVYLRRPSRLAVAVATRFEAGSSGTTRGQFL